MSLKKASKLLHALIKSNNHKLSYINYKYNNNIHSSKSITPDLIRATSCFNINHQSDTSSSLHYSILFGLLGFASASINASHSQCDFKSNNHHPDDKPEFIPRDKFKGSEKGYVYRC